MSAKRVPVRLCDIDIGVRQEAAWNLARGEKDRDKRMDILAAAVWPSDEVYYVDEDAAAAILNVAQPGLSKRLRPNAPVFQEDAA